MFRAAQFAVFVGLVACGSKHSSTPDAPLCTSGPDRDADGICDDVDDCPDDYDPGQLDLDHDGRGWVCDPVESVPAMPYLQFVAARGMLHGSSMAAVLHRGNGVEQFVGASPAGGGTASAETGDQWATGVVMSTPMVSPDGDLLVDVDDGTVSGVGVFDGATRTFHGKVLGAVNSFGVADGAVAVIATETREGATDIVVPSAGGLTSLAMRGRLVNVNTGTQLSGAGSPPSFAIPSMTSSNALVLDTFTAGSSTVSQPVSPSVTAVTSPNTSVQPRYDEVPLCVNQGQKITYVGVGTPTTVGDLPFLYCPFTAVPDAVTGQTGFLLGQVANQKFDIVAVSHGVLIPVATNLPNPAMTVTGGTIPVVAGLLPGPAPNVSDVWALGSQGAVQLASLANAVISTEGHTVHVVGLAPGTNGEFNVVLVRYRDDQLPQQVVLQTQVGATFTLPNVVTTSEGAALVSGYNAAWVVPSTSMNSTSLALGRIDGGSRGSSTVFLGTEINGSRAQLFAYDEIGGAARLTALTTLADKTSLYMIDPPEGKRSTWFTYTSAGDCHIAQLVYSGTTPSFAHAVSCGDPAGVNAWGWTPDGQLAVESIGIGNATTTVYKLGDDAATTTMNSQVVYGNQNTAPVLDRSGYPAQVVGWWSVDANGGFACLARHPERCWAVPISNTYNPPVVMAARASTDDTDELGLLWYPGPNGNEAVFLHAIGSGEYAPPL